MNMMPMLPYETYDEYRMRCRRLYFARIEEEAAERVRRHLDAYERSGLPEMIRRIIERAESRMGQDGR